MSRSASRGAMVYVQAAAREPRHVLEQIEETLQALGASRSDLFAEHETAWSDWLRGLRRPLRVWRVSGTERRIDVTVTATK